LAGSPAFILVDLTALIFFGNKKKIKKKNKRKKAKKYDVDDKQ
jgi:hypothetical protein